MFYELRINNLLKRDLSVGMYLNLPDRIKHDPRIIEHLISNDNYNIQSLDDADALDLVLNNYELVKYLDRDKLNKFFDKLDLSRVIFNEELFLKLELSKQDLIFKYDPFLYVELISEDKRWDKIKEFVLAVSGNREEKEKYSHYVLEKEILNKMILSLRAKDILSLTNVLKYHSDYVVDLLENLDLDLAYNLYCECEELFFFFKNDVQYEIEFMKIGNNLDKIVELDDWAQAYYFSKHLEFLRYANISVIALCLQDLGNLNADIYVKLNKKRGQGLHNFLSLEEFDKILVNDITALSNGIRPKKLNNLILMRIDKIGDVKKREWLKKYYLSKSDGSYLEKNGYNIAKIFYDDYVINNNTIEMLEKYFNTFDRDLLVQMLVNAYGEHVLKIFKERPNLDVMDIENFKIFDKKIYNILGESFINYVLSYKIDNLNYIIGKLAINYDTLISFKDYFDCISSDYGKLDINIISNLLEKFMLFEDVIKEIDFNNITEDRKRNLKLLCSDMDKVAMCVTSIDDLDNYVEIRKKRFIDIIETLVDEMNIPSLKDHIFAYVTGKNVNDGVEVDLESLSLEKAIKAFNIDRIVKDDMIIQKIDLDKDEVSILLLLHEVNREVNVGVLKDVFKALVSKDLDSLVFGSIFNKIKKYYTNDLKENLLSRDKLDLMDKEVIDDVEVVSFNGERFDLISSVNGLNLSTNRIYTSNYGDVLLDDWLNREKGVSTISTALCSSDTSIYPVDYGLWEKIGKRISFVFDSNVDVLGMGGSDIFVTHNGESNKHLFRHMMETDFRFSTLDELKETINENKKDNDDEFQSEITIARKEEDIRKDNAGKRVMPIGIYVIGDITSEVLETAKLFNEYYQKNGLGKFRIIRVNPSKYKDQNSDSDINDNIKENDDYSYGKSI